MSSEGLEAKLKTTVLHDIYPEFGTKKLKTGAFGGYNMAIQFDHPFTEHIAVRSTAGWFDTSHMGRYKLTGDDVEPFLQYLLTNDVASLDQFGDGKGMAQYTFLSNEIGRAKDDAYVYRTEQDEFMLVVNAGNRDKDWKHITSVLEANKDKYKDVNIEDVSESIAMIALQGPNSELIMENLLVREGNDGNLPKAKANHISIANYQGSDLMISRTGYTGETIRFELFVESDKAQQFARDLHTFGKQFGLQACGLAARDSLRLEAGLGLYGHDLDEDTPIYALKQAAFGVNLADKSRDLIGKSDLEVYQKDFAAIRSGAYIDLDEMRLKRVIQELMAEGNRSLREGDVLYYEGKQVGDVTSGGFAPKPGMQGNGLHAKPAEEWAMDMKRSIGMALVDSNIRFDPDEEMRFQVYRDSKGELKDTGIIAKLVKNNHIPLAPYSRAQSGEVAVPPEPQTISGSMEEFANIFVGATVENTQWRQHDCFNLIASENTISDIPRALASLDPMGRYNEYKFIEALGSMINYYMGTKFQNGDENAAWPGILSIVKRELMTGFNCYIAMPDPISGQQANEAFFGATMDSFNKDIIGEPARLSRVMNTSLAEGGHLSFQPFGGIKDYIARDERGKFAITNFPMSKDDPYKIDVNATTRLMEQVDPRLLILGRSMITQPEPVRELRAAIDEMYDKNDPNKPILYYDASHVLGLLPDFQDPLAEGADFMGGSAHKTSPMANRGLILTNRNYNDDLVKRVNERIFPGKQSNGHLHTLLAMGYSAREMNEFGPEYRKQMIKNTAAFSKALTDYGVEVEGVSTSHQVLVRVDKYQGNKQAERLEDNNIIVSPQGLYDDLSFFGSSGLRLGVQEMTRFGMKEEHFGELAEYIARALKGENVKKQVTDFRKQFTTMQYCLPEEIAQPMVEKIHNAYKMAA